MPRPEGSGKSIFGLFSRVVGIDRARSASLFLCVSDWLGIHIYVRMGAAQPGIESLRVPQLICPSSAPLGQQWRPTSSAHFFPCSDGERRMTAQRPVDLRSKSAVAAWPPPLSSSSSLAKCSRKRERALDGSAAKKAKNLKSVDGVSAQQGRTTIAILEIIIVFV